MIRKKGGWSRLLVDLFACFLIPAYTLLFAGSVAWFSTNFSVIAVTGEDHYRGFFLWGGLAAGYFLAVLLPVTRTLTRLRWTTAGLVLLGCLSLGLALLVPYLPDYFPKFAQLHVLLAFAACALVMAALLLILLDRRRAHRARYAPLLRAWWLIVAGSGAIFALAGMVSSALEVFFTITAALLARKLWLYRKS